MEERLNPLTILEYEREIASYTVNVLAKKQKDKQVFEEENYELDNAVHYIESRAKFYGSIITSELLELQEDQISYFVELEHRFKTRFRIREKILQKMVVDKRTMRDAINGIYDALRFTIVISDDVYTDKVEEYLHKIESFGYKVIRFKNAWGNEYYQGINVSFIDQDGFKFELQFHTPNGYSIKEGKLRDVYNIIRDPESPPDLVKKSNAIRKYYQAQVRIPVGALGYQYDSDVKKRG